MEYTSMEIKAGKKVILKFDTFEHEAQAMRLIRDHFFVAWDSWVAEALLEMPTEYLEDK